MSTPVSLRSDFDAAQLHKLARGSRDPDQTRRLLALAEVYAGGSRSGAARIGGVGLQIVRDWVLRFNAEGPDGLLNGKAPGVFAVDDAAAGEAARPRRSRMVMCRSSQMATRRRKMLPPRAVEIHRDSATGSRDEAYGRSHSAPRGLAWTPRRHVRDQWLQPLPFPKLGMRNKT